MYHWWGWTVWLVTAATTTNDASIFHGENIVPPARYYVCVINNHLLLMTWKLLGSHGKQLRNAACTEPHQLKARLRVFVVVVLRRRRNYYILRKNKFFFDHTDVSIVYLCVSCRLTLGLDDSAYRDECWDPGKKVMSF